jgi:hypothetical protein
MVEPEPIRRTKENKMRFEIMKEQGKFQIWDKKRRLIVASFHDRDLAEKVAAQFEIPEAQDPAVK